MKKLKTILSMIIVGCCAFIPMMNVDAAETYEASSKEDFLNYINTSADGDTVKLTTSITLDNVNEIIQITNKEITIEGVGDVTITGFRDDAIEKDTLKGNYSIIVAGEGAKVHVKNLSLERSQKYGVQAYNGGYASVENVYINDCRYGGVLVNAGTVEIISLRLGFNGSNKDETGMSVLNNGIEISKSKNIADPNATPNIIMNGTLNSDVSENVIYFASDANDNTTGFIIENAATTTDKILVNDNKVVVADATNEVKFTSNEMKADTVVEGDEYVPNIDVTDPVEPETPVEEVKNEEVNPETSDGILLFLGLTVVGFAGTALAYRRLHN